MQRWVQEDVERYYWLTVAGDSIEHQKFGGSGESVRWHLAPANLEKRE
jgi:hypothetical protein